MTNRSSSAESAVEPAMPEPATSANSLALARLRRRWGMIAAIYLLAAVFGYWRLSISWQSTYTQRWLVIVLIVVARELWLLWKSLPANHRDGERNVLPAFGYGTALTLGRGLAIALLAGFIFSPRPPGWLAWLPALLYSLGAILDYLDGYVARTTDHATKLGEILDMEFDVIGVLAAVLLAISYGQLPIWYLAIGLAREIFLFGHWVLRKLGRPVYDLPPSTDRRLIAGLQMGFLSVVLWPVFTPPATTLAAVLFAVPLIISFGRDWLVTSGMLPEKSQRYRRTRHIAKALLERWLPVAARLLGGVAALSILQREMPTFAGWLPYADGLGIERPDLLVWVAVLLSAIALCLFVAGIIGRLAALFLIILAAWDILAVGFLWPSNGLLLGCAIIVLQAGSGAFSLWQPEEKLLRRRAGEQKAAAA